MEHEVPTRPIPTVNTEKWRQISATAHACRLPLVIPGLFQKQSQLWSPERLATQWSNKEVVIADDLPVHGVPYREQAKNYQRRIKLSDFVSLLSTGRSCYLNQAPLRDYPQLLEELDVKNLFLTSKFALNLWVGSKTRSGLHFDNADNLFGQIYGKKRATLISPEYSKFLYPFPDSPSKSQVDLDALDLKRYPRCKNIEMWTCELNPGDGLYMPRGWWHHICSEDVSISINCWHGESLSDVEYLRLIFSGGPRIIMRAVYDFVWHGVFKRPFRHRLFSAPPPGVRAYEKLVSH